MHQVLQMAFQLLVSKKDLSVQTKCKSVIIRSLHLLDEEGKSIFIPASYVVENCMNTETNSGELEWKTEAESWEE